MCPTPFTIFRIFPYGTLLPVNATQSYIVPLISIIVNHHQEEPIYHPFLVNSITLPVTL
jgi:hypothetical protein